MKPLKKSPIRREAGKQSTVRNFISDRCISQPDIAISALDRCMLEGQKMSKGNSKRGNKEAKKPKQEKPKVSTTANSLAGKPALAIGGKKVK